MHSPSYRRHFQTAPHVGPSSRLPANRLINTIKYSPYDDEEKERDGILGKVTSRITGMLKDIKSAVGSMFKQVDEEEIILDVHPIAKNESLNKDIDLPNLQNHPIQQVNFAGLAQVLTIPEPLKSPQVIELDRTNPHGMSMSFGGPVRNTSVESVNQAMLISFQKQENSISRNMSIRDDRDNAFETSEQMERSLSLLNRQMEAPKRYKVNTKRVLDFCNEHFEHINAIYSQKYQKTFGKGLKTLITKGLPKPMPLKTTTPTIEFKFNKVIGKYEPIRLLKKRKRGEVDSNIDLKDQEFLNFAMYSEKEKHRNPYKKNKLTTTTSEKSSTQKILVNLKSTSTKNAAQKKPQFFINNLETYETDETEDQEQKRESPFLNTIFEEDKIDFNFNETLSQISNKSSVSKRDQSVQTSEVKQLHKGLTNSLRKCPSPLRSKSLSRLSSFEKESVSEKKSAPSQVGNSQNSQQHDMSYEKESIESNGIVRQDSLPKSNEASNSSKAFDRGSLFLLTNQEDKNSKEINQAEEPIIDVPKTPTFNNHIGKGGLFNFDSAKSEEEKTSNVHPQTGTLEQSPFSIKITEYSKEKDNQENVSPFMANEPNPASRALSTVETMDTKCESNQSTFEFLKPYQATTNIHENNPFLNKKTDNLNMSFDGTDNKQQENPSKPEAFNPFLNPQKADIFSLINNKSSENQAPALTKTLSSVTSLTSNLFSSQPSQPAQNLFNFPLAASSTDNKPTNNMATGLFGPMESIQPASRTTNNIMSSNIFENNAMMEADEIMERENSVGMHNTLFQQKPNNTFAGLLQNNNNRENNLFGNMGNSTSGIGQNASNNLFNGGSFGMNQNASGNLNSPFSLNNMTRTTSSPNFGMNQNAFTNQSTAANTPNLFSMNSTPPVQSNNILFSGQNQFNSSNNASSNNLFQGGFQSNQGISQMGAPQDNQRQVQDAVNFLGGGGNNNQNNQQQTQQQRVYRKIIQPGAKNKERAF